MENTSFEDDINVISDLCNGTKTRDEITQALESANGILDDAVSTLLELQENHEVEEISVASKIVPMDLTDALLSFFSKVDPFEDIEVTINRQELWKDAQGFYKKALDKPVKLLRNFVVKIKNEDGVDAGAVRLEFWSLVLKEINERLFEGHLHERMPRRNCGNFILFKMCGSVIAHSLLNKGPAFPCLAPWVYQYLHSAPQESVLLTMISPQQIVKTGATEKLLMLIEGLESCKYDEELDSLLDGVNKEVYDQIISSSQWPIGCLISIENKHLLIQELVFDELVRKRQNQLQAMKEGLAYIDFLQYMERFPDLMRPLFIHQEKVLVPVFFKDNMKRPTLNSPPQEKAYSWFLAYIDEGEAKDEDFPQGRLIALLEFCTAFTSVPPFGLPYQFVIDFLDDDDAKVLPEASACFGHLQIPTVHCSKEAFFKNMDTGLKYGRKGFGKL